MIADCRLPIADCLTGESSSSSSSSSTSILFHSLWRHAAWQEVWQHNADRVQRARSVCSAPACPAPYTQLGSGTRPQHSRTPCSPSPRPSPTGRGRTISRLAANQRVADGRTRRRRFPLSLGERAGVRGSGVGELDQESGPPACALLHKMCVKCRACRRFFVADRASFAAP
jgi:hypothetical protein